LLLDRVKIPREQIGALTDLLTGKEGVSTMFDGLVELILKKREIAQEEGREAGLNEGLKKGREKGLNEGLKKGREAAYREKLESARKLKERGLAINEIVEILNLPPATAAEL
jgi:flagellar biosynthesis/type III secretory pathway protein FliH